MEPDEIIVRHAPRDRVNARPHTGHEARHDRTPRPRGRGKFYMLLPEESAGSAFVRNVRSAASIGTVASSAEKRASPYAHHLDAHINHDLAEHVQWRACAQLAMRAAFEDSTLPFALSLEARNESPFFEKGRKEIRMPTDAVDRPHPVSVIRANTIIAILGLLLVCGCAGHAPSPAAEVSRTAPVAAIHTQPMPPRHAVTPEPLPTESRVQSIALLLPFSGRFANPATALRDGFFSAHLASRNPRPHIHVFDSGETGDSALAAYDAAMELAPDIVVGPLLREQVRALASQRRLIRPVLALNYLDDAFAPPPLLFQFGLSPQDEAREAAASAIGSDLRSAVVLSEATEWGDRTASAFRDRFEALGGIVLASRRFSVDGDEPTAAIRELLDRTTLEGSGTGELEMVFVAAGAAQARIIIPELRFFWRRPNELVVYGAAASYDRSQDVTDREGLRFCDMPLVLSPDTMEAHPGDTTSGQPVGQTRLHGLGFDAYRAARAIYRNSFGAGSSIDGKSGILVVQDDGQILRRLSCWQVSGGHLQALDDSAPAAVY
jgi:hypothetical protein